MPCLKKLKHRQHIQIPGHVSTQTHALKLMVWWSIIFRNIIADDNALQYHNDPPRTSAASHHYPTKAELASIQGEAHHCIADMRQQNKHMTSPNKTMVGCKIHGKNTVLI